ncbi:MAG: class I tRNA ligase family protein [Saprospiraceae bacterium]
MYKTYKQLNLPAIDQEILQFWEEADIFAKSVHQRDADNSYVFFEGPPSANGLPGIHHVMARTIKDTFCRFHTLLGKRVDRKGGWDTHGLPIELSVERNWASPRTILAKASPLTTTTSSAGKPSCVTRTFGTILRGKWATGWT